jgi:phosphohistidine phosphatase
MKKLLIIRHAKSDQSFFGNDFERPLNERGKADAPMMANRLLKKNMVIDAFMSSPAKRAKKTAELFAEVFKVPQNDIFFSSALYHATVDVFNEVVLGLPDHFNTVALFSHNPGITYFVNSLQIKAHADNMPTCGIFAVEADILHWKDFFKSNKTFLFFDFPKK